MSPAKQPSMLRLSFSLYRAHWRQLVLLAIPPFIVTLVLAVLAVIIPFSIIVTLPFFIGPFWYAYVISVTIIVTRDELPTKGFYSFLMIGANPAIRRAWHPFTTLMKMGLVALLSIVTLTMLANWVAPVFLPDLAIAFADLSSFASTPFDLEQLQTFIAARQAIFDPYFASITSIATLMAMIFLLVDYGKKIHVANLIMIKAVALPWMDVIASRVKEVERKRINKMTWAGSWPLLTALMMGSLFGLWFGLELKVSLVLIELFALLGGFLLAAPFFPQYFLTAYLTFDSLKELYTKEITSELEAQIRLIEKSEHLSAEQKEHTASFYRNTGSVIDPLEPEKDDARPEEKEANENQEDHDDDEK